MPNSNGLTGTEEDLEGGRVANVIKPSITVYKADKPNGGHHHVPRRWICPSGHEPRRPRHGALAQCPRYHLYCTEIPHAERKPFMSTAGDIDDHPPCSPTYKGMEHPDRTASGSLGASGGNIGSYRASIQAVTDRAAFQMLFYRVFRYFWHDPRRLPPKTARQQTFARIGG